MFCCAMILLCQNAPGSTLFTDQTAPGSGQLSCGWTEDGRPGSEGVQWTLVLRTSWALGCVGMRLEFFFFFFSLLFFFDIESFETLF